MCVTERFSPLRGGLELRTRIAGDRSSCAPKPAELYARCVGFFFNYDFQSLLIGSMTSIRVPHPSQPLSVLGKRSFLCLLRSKKHLVLGLRLSAFSPSIFSPTIIVVRPFVCSSAHFFVSNFPRPRSFQRSSRCSVCRKNRSALYVRLAFSRRVCCSTSEMRITLNCSQLVRKQCRFAAC